MMYEPINKKKTGLHRTVDAALEYLIFLADYVARVHLDRYYS